MRTGFDLAAGFGILIVGCPVACFVAYHVGKWVGRAEGRSEVIYRRPWSDRWWWPW